MVEVNEFGFISEKLNYTKVYGDNAYTLTSSNWNNTMVILGSFITLTDPSLMGFDRNTMITIIIPRDTSLYVFPDTDNELSGLDTRTNQGTEYTDIVIDEVDFISTNSKLYNDAGVASSRYRVKKGNIIKLYADITNDKWHMIKIEGCSDL